jgi:ribose 5-phosphate isomerase B
MKVAVGSDHRGFDARQVVKALIVQMGHECIDFGTDDPGPVDYPDLAFVVATAVSQKQVDRAILICATGLGMSIAANKVKGIRAALCHDELTARIARDHNDTNVLCLSGDQIGEVVLRKTVEAWMNTEFSGGRHQRRVNKITAIEEGRDPREVTNG